MNTASLDHQGLDVVLPPSATAGGRRRLVARSLIAADVLGLTLAFAFSVILFGLSGPGAQARPAFELLVFVLSLPAWVLLASGLGLYRHDDGRIGHSSVDDLWGIVQLVTFGSWLFFIGCWITGISNPRAEKLLCFWLSAIALVLACRGVARMLYRRSPAYAQRTAILGGGDIGQRIARKLRQHREYGITLVGIVDDAPRARRGDLSDVELLGGLDDLPEIVGNFDIDRVIVAFSHADDCMTADIVRELRAMDVQVDVVPRLYELVGPRVDLHAIEGLPVVGLPAARPRRAALAVKRATDIVCAATVLALVSPLMAFIAWKVHRSSPGPVFFRQRRLGLNMREFTVLKFRTMYDGANDAEHRRFIAETIDPRASVNGNGLYKLDRKAEITPFGGWLRKTSLDELPQLINVLRGDMSLVGPRPCIPYEIEYFKHHHFERFLMPQGLTGLWQVTARASASFGEALDMDVAYVRGWSLGLDLRLLLRTPLQLLRTGGTA
jgi:exopolysaccharide biosynthesis polyprenyl glycosylphosphotransferase